ncbi:hypothetical protein Csa_023965, partial [Cucumis sativus]
EGIYRNRREKEAAAVVVTAVVVQLGVWKEEMKMGIGESTVEIIESGQPD